MKFDQPKNENYTATIASVKKILQLAGRDRIVGIPMFGHQAIVSKGWDIGELGVFFPAEVQLSPEYARENNMFRHEENNADPTIKGYLDDNRRVRAIKLGGHESNALFMPLTSLSFTGIDVSELRDGDTFDSLNGVELCRKYEIRVPRTANPAAFPAAAKGRVDKRHFPEHISTVNYWKMQEGINTTDYLHVTQKLHGTSIRVANTRVTRKLPLRDRVAKNWFGVAVQEATYDYVYGSRRVTKDANNTRQNHFYDTDIWTIHGKRLDGLIPRGYMLYGELIGWTPSGEPIQPGYTYDLPKGAAELYAYRVSHINEGGIEVDLSWTQVQEFCSNIGVKTVPELFAGPAYDFHVEDYMNIRFRDEWAADPVQLSDPGSVDEGVVVRIDGLRPRLFKAKSSRFLEHETRQLDAGTADIESDQAEPLDAAA